jgi:hypothetical protein
MYSWYLLVFGLTYAVYFFFLFFLFLPVRSSVETIIKVNIFEWNVLGSSEMLWRSLWINLTQADRQKSGQEPE